MVEVRGLVLHIAVGWYEGTIAWQLNPDSNVSSHFVVGREPGELAQMVDTDDRAWTQGDGNGRWLSSENEGFLVPDSRNPGGWERLSEWQIEANARLLARAHREYGVPLQVADHPGERGLGHHSMDREWLDEQWGHEQCPGKAIIAQKPLIVARAQAIVEGEDDVSAADTWSYDPGRRSAPGAIRNPEWRADSDTNPTVQPRYAVESIWNHVHRIESKVDAERRASRLRHEAVLAAVQGLDTQAILERIDQRASDAAADRAELLDTLAEVLPGRIADRLTDVSPEQVRSALREELSALRLVAEPAGGEG